MHKILNKLIILSLVFAFVLSSFAFVPLKTAAEALQSKPPSDDNGGDPGGSKDGNGGGGGKSILGTVYGGITNGICGVMGKVKGAITGKASGLIDSGINSFSKTGGGGPLDVFGGGSGGEVPVAENQNRQKETCLDPIARATAKFFIRKMTKDLVAWIKGGFNGKPKFIQDFGDYLKDAGDTAGGMLLEQILGKQNEKLLCESWKQDITIEVLVPIPKKDKSFWTQCKVSDIIAAAQGIGVDVNVDVNTNENRKNRVNAFANDFSQGGWPAFLTTALFDENNPIGYKLSLESLKQQEMDKATEAAKVEAVASSGMLPGICIKRETFSYAAHGEKKDKQVCAKSKILTPGTAIVNALPEQFGSGLKELQVADELNEVFAATIDVLTQKRFWEGIVGSDEPEIPDSGEPIYHGGWQDDMENFNPSTQLPATLSPKNGEIIKEPIKFDWTDVDFGGETVKNYQIYLTYPDGITHKVINTGLAPDPDGSITPEDKTDDIAPSEFQISQSDFDELDQGGEYTWQVAAINEGPTSSDEDDEVIGGVSGWSNQSTFNLPTPTGLNPKEGEIYTKPIKFSFRPVVLKDVASYEIKLTNLTETEDPIIKNSDDTNYTQTKEEFEAMKGGEYELKVKALDSNGQMLGRESPPLKFKVLAKPKLLSPAGQATISLPYNFSWNPVPLANHYKLSAIRIINGNTFTKETDNASSLKVESLGHEGNYKWRLMAQITDEDGKIVAGSAWSDFENFTLNLNIPTASASVSLENSKPGSAVSSISFDESPTTIYLWGEGNDNSAVTDYTWTCNNGTLTSASAQNTTLTIPSSVDTDTNYACSLVTTDDSGNKSSPSTVSITIKNKPEQ